MDYQIRLNEIAGERKISTSEKTSFSVSYIITCKSYNNSQIELILVLNERWNNYDEKMLCYLLKIQKSAFCIIKHNYAKRYNHDKYGNYALAHALMCVCGDPTYSIVLILC